MYIRKISADLTVCSKPVQQTNSHLKNTEGKEQSYAQLSLFLYIRDKEHRIKGKD